jgi:anti-sigma factor RsiW
VTAPLDCVEVVELVTSYLDGALDDATAERVREHLELCDGCREYVEQLRATVRLTGTLTLDDLSTDAESALLQAFRDWRRRDS